MFPLHSAYPSVLHIHRLLALPIRAPAPPMGARGGVIDLVLLSITHHVDAVLISYHICFVSCSAVSRGASCEGRVG